MPRNGNEEEQPFLPICVSASQTQLWERERHRHPPSIPVFFWVIYAGGSFPQRKKKLSLAAEEAEEEEAQLPLTFYPKLFCFSFFRWVGWSRVANLCSVVVSVEGLCREERGGGEN